MGDIGIISRIVGSILAASFIAGVAVAVDSLAPLESEPSSCLLSNAAESDFPNSLVVSLLGEADGIVAAWYDGATRRYRHGVLGDDIEASELHVITNRGGEQCGQRLVLESNEVFEDLAPRLVDMDGDGNPDVVAIVSDVRLGARLAVFGHEPGGTDKLVLKAATPNIGSRYRWLAPVGIGDFNDDGTMDVAFVDRPHLAKILRVFSYDPETGLNQITFAQGFTNHRIGEDFISSGVRTCDGQLQLITVDSNWERILATTLNESTLTTTDVGAFEDIESIKAALSTCPN